VRGVTKNTDEDGTHGTAQPVIREVAVTLRVNGSAEPVRLDTRGTLLDALHDR
jgi:hypothetical protein